MEKVDGEPQAVERSQTAWRPRHRRGVACSQPAFRAASLMGHGTVALRTPHRMVCLGGASQSWGSRRAGSRRHWPERQFLSCEESRQCFFRRACAGSEHMYEPCWFLGNRWDPETHFEPIVCIPFQSLSPFIVEFLRMTGAAEYQIIPNGEFMEPRRIAVAQK